MYKHIYIYIYMLCVHMLCVHMFIHGYMNYLGAECPIVRNLLQHHANCMKSVEPLEGEWLIEGRPLVGESITVSEGMQVPLDVFIINMGSLPSTLAV